ncbi:DNA-binding protein [halophilic archaeon]|nr:DNA-binding protein [halophilic archaeon]
MAEDAFGHAHGRPTFEPGLNAGTDASDGEVQIQKACRLIDLTHKIDEAGEYYGAILEHSFIVIEHTLQGYLLAMTGADAMDLRDHTSPYEFAKGQVPLEDTTVESLKNLYHARRTEHYYGTTVTTEAQAIAMQRVATAVHGHIVTFDPQLKRLCQCSLDNNL